MIYVFECQYCGHKFQKQIYVPPKPGSEKCWVCKDRNLKCSAVEDSYLDTYIGCPAFKEDEDLMMPIYIENLGSD